MLIIKYDEEPSQKRVCINEILIDVIQKTFDVEIYLIFAFFGFLEFSCERLELR
jgi:hypothetical protein